MSVLGSKGVPLKVKLHDVSPLLQTQQWLNITLKIKANITQWTSMYYISFSTIIYLANSFNSSASHLPGSLCCIYNQPVCYSLNMPGTLLPQAFALRLPSACGTCPQ